MNNCGIVTIAVGEKAKEENKLCINSLTNIDNSLTILTLDTLNSSGTIVPNKHCQVNSDLNNMQLSRLIKVNLINYIPQEWQYCIYLDSDTRVLSSDILRIFDVLQSGYDLAIVPSQSQDFWHIGIKETTDSIVELGYKPLQLQCGVFGFSVNDQMRDFFLQWSNEYVLYYNQDQMAFQRALHKVPVKYWLMGKAFNSSNGSVVQHLFGRTR